MQFHWIDMGIAKWISYCLIAYISLVRSQKQKGAADLVPTKTMRTSTDAYYYYDEKLKFHDAKTFCESTFEGEIFPSIIDDVVTKRLQMMKTVFWIWATPNANSSETSTPCRIAMIQEKEVSIMNVRCDGNAYPFLCRIPFSKDNDTSCGKGYLTLRSGRCLDVDECMDGVACRGYHSKCQNVPGSYRCQCQHGMQGNGVNVCGYLHSFSHTVEATAIPPIPLTRRRLRALQNRLFRALGAGFVSKVAIRSITNSSGPNMKKVYYYVYTKVKAFNVRKLQWALKSRTTSGYADSLWVKKWKTARAFDGGCVPTVHKAFGFSFHFPESFLGDSVSSAEKCPTTGKAKAVVQCRMKRIDGANVTSLDYTTLKESDCPPKFDEEQSGNESSRHKTMHTLQTTLPPETAEITTQNIFFSSQNPTKLKSQPAAGRFTTSLDDLLGKFVKSLKSNVTFRSSPEAFNFGRNLLLGTISNAESDSSIKVSSNAMGLATQMLDWLIENPGSIKSSIEEKTNLALAFEKLPLKVDLSNESHYSVETNMVALQVTKVVMQNETDVEFQTTHSNETLLVSRTRASLPREVAQFVRESSNSSTYFNAGFLVYKNTSLFAIPSSEYDGAELPQVISVGVSSAKSIQNLSQPFWYRMPVSQHQTKKKTLSFFHCGFLNETTKNWSTQGCHYVPDTNPPNCTCNHLTNFALLVKNVEMLDDLALGIFGKIACSLSVIALIWTFGCYALSKDLRRIQINQIHMHMCFSLLSAYLLFLIGVERTENKRACMSVAAILHFFLLSTWGWMTVEAVTMYRKLVNVFGRMKDNYVIISAICVYSISFIIVITTVTITVYRYDNTYMTTWHKDSENFKLFNSFYVSERLCWLRGIPLFVSFLGPVAISLVISYICFTQIMKSITCDRRKVTSSRKMSKLDEVKNYLTRAGAISAILGMTWVFAIPLAISDEPISSMVFSWLFSIFNALQGFAIFIFFCVRRKEIRDVWMSAIKSVGSTRSRRKIASDVSFTQNYGTTYNVTHLNKNTEDMVIRSIN